MGRRERDMTDTKRFVITNDTGAIKVGTDAFYVLIQTALQDHKLHAIEVFVSDGPTDTNGYKQVTVIKGALSIMNHKENLAHLSGRYGVYVKTEDENASVIFEKWNSL